MTKKLSDISVSLPNAKRKRGGQLNNKNAYKHGFYSKYFSSLENKVLSEIPLADVKDIIDLMRISTGRFLEAYTASLAELDYEDKHAAFRSLGMNAGVIASLIRIHLSTSKNVREANELTEAFRKTGEDLEEEKEEESEEEKDQE